MDDDETSTDPVGPAAAPPPLPPLDLDTTVVRRGGGRGRLAVGAALVVALVAGGLFVVARDGDGSDADASLAAAQAVVEANDSYRFELLTVSRQVIGDPDGAGSDTTTRSLTTGDVAAPDRWHVVMDAGDDLGMDVEPFETTRVGDVVYASDPMGSFGDEAVQQPKWIQSPAGDMAMSAADIASMYEDTASLGDDESGFDESYDDSFRLDLVMMAYLTTLQGQPSGITRLVTDATDPVVEEQLGDGGVRLRTTLPPLPELADVGDEPIPAVDVLLDLNAADEPVHATFTAEGGTATARVEVTFSDWGAEISIAVPAEGDIDRTPWLAEEALAALDPALLVAPTDVPDSIALVSADVYPSDEVDGPEGCDSLELAYGSESDYSMTEDPTEGMTDDEVEAFYDAMAYLSVSVTSAPCAAEYGSTEFDAELGGRPASGEEGFWAVQVGDAVVTIDSSYEDDVLAALVASIRPVTVDELAAAVPEWAADAGAYGGGWFSGAPAFGL